MPDTQNDLRTEHMIINYGPQHPSMHGTLRVLLETDGERVVRAIPEIGFLHCGFEKLGEHHTYQKWITVTDRMDYLSACVNNVAYCMAVEKLLGIEVPERAQRIRLILCELSRISNHLVALGTHVMDLGAMTYFLWTFRERETIYDILEMITGGRMTMTYTRIGGLASDMPRGWVEKVRAFVRAFPDCVDEYESLVTRNRIFLDRTQGIAAISGEDALNWGLSGPSLRGSGVAWDLRRADPIMGYDKYDWDVAVAPGGDVYSRYLVRTMEMRESCRILAQAIEDIPEGPVIVDDPKVALPPKDLVYNRMESMIHHFKLVMHGLEPPVGEV